ncbi:hypothetical protein FGG08_007179 [Glutinoglossum americanum]|uniref:Uncharacterized protein n=1 Tax=Glutinoglossum americanum TaxID=1670608 RepID=A0A9P8HZV6_9PEZI|nr:hypothetical protein FGG08_007179 [Glutinoglossum americanum]
MSRTITTRQKIFHLPTPDTATFDFSHGDDGIRITVPAGSTWSVKYHWHINHLGCRSVECLEGALKVFFTSTPFGSGGKLGHARWKFSFRPGQRVAWGPSRTEEKLDTLIVSLVADEILYRNTCSAILDADRFPLLASTPLWLRAVFAVLTFLPAARQWLVAMMLWVQLRMIFFAHDYWVYHGQLNVKWWWKSQPFGHPNPPKWASELQYWSQHAISRVVMATCYWVGKLLLGMKGEYEEYTPERNEETVGLLAEVSVMRI